MQWTYVADSGQPYQVILHHGDPSGHVMVAVNGRVSIIDFFVRQNKTYSLVLEDELMLLEIERTDQGFRYGFTIDENADTQRNRRRRREEFRQYALAGSLGLVVLAGLIALALWFGRRQEAQLARRLLPVLEERGRPSLAWLGSDKQGEAVWYYTHKARVLRLEAGDMPLPGPDWQPGDDALLYYWPDKPAIARVIPAQSGPRRSLRLLEAWILRDLPAGAAPPSCLQDWQNRPPPWLTDRAMPWHQTRGPDLPTWLSDCAGQRQPEPSLCAELEACARQGAK